MGKISLKLRLTLWYTILMVLVSTVVLIFTASYEQRMLYRDCVDRLVKAVDGLIIHIDNTVENESNEDKALPLLFFDRGVHMVLVDENHDIIDGQLPFSTTEELDFKLGVIRKMGYDGNRYLVYDRKVLIDDDTDAYIKGIIPVDESYHVLVYALRNHLIATFVMILLAAVGGYYITHRALAPLGVMNQTARSIMKSKDLSQRINAKSNNEIGELANTLDEMLGEIQRTFEREQRFASNVSHELRTPIAVIFSECEYMTDCAETVEELKNSAESIKEEARRMSKLVSELFTISRMDKGTLKVNYEETELSDLLNFVCDQQESINDKSISLKRDIAPDVNAEVDRSKIAGLFINLISNAYKYNRKNGEITVSLREDDGNIIFSVSDTGIGISKDDLPRIWDRFYQGDPARTSNENGSMGLGLSMVKWIAEKHGGEVTVRSEPDIGSTFTLTMPKKAQQI